MSGPYFTSKDFEEEPEEQALEGLHIEIPDLSDDPDELREQLAEYGPKVLAQQCKIAHVVSQRILHKLQNPKTPVGKAEATWMGIAIDKMAKAAELLQQFAPTRFDITNEIPFPGMRCPKCKALVFDTADMSGFDEEDNGNGDEPE